MKTGKPRARAVALALAALALGVGAALVLSASAPGPSLDDLEPLLAARRFDEAARRVAAYLRAHPADDRANVLMAQVALARDDQEPKRALDHLARVRGSDRAVRAIVRLNEGKAYSALGRYDLAEAAWKEALRLNPRVPEAGWALLGLYYIQGRHAEARRLGLELHAIEPDPHDRVQLLVELLRQDALTPVYETIVPTLEPIVRAHPEDIHTAIALGLALVRCSRADEGLAVLRAAVARCNDDPEVQDALLLGLDESRRIDELAKALEALPARLAELPRFERYRAAIAQERNDWQAAADAYLRAWQADPSDLQVLYRLNRVLRTAGRQEQAEEFDGKVREAIAAREQALAIYREANGDKTLGLSPHPELYQKIADLRERMARPEEALAWHRLVVRDQPDNPVSRRAVERLEAMVEARKGRAPSS